MVPGVLCLIVLAMPFAAGVCAAFSAARAKPRPCSAKTYRLGATVGDGVADLGDDSELFR